MHFDRRGIHSMAAIDTWGKSAGCFLFCLDSFPSDLAWPDFDHHEMHSMAAIDTTWGKSAGHILFSFFLHWLHSDFASPNWTTKMWPKMYFVISLLLLHLGYFPSSIKEYPGYILEFRVQTLFLSDVEATGYFRLISQYYSYNLINAAWFKDWILLINAVAWVRFPSLMESSSQHSKFPEL